MHSLFKSLCFLILYYCVPVYVPREILVSLYFSLLSDPFRQRLSDVSSSALRGRPLA